MTDTTKNQGTAHAAASTTFIYFSLDAILDGGDAQIGTRPVDALNAGSSSSGPTQVTIPGNAVPGTTAFIIVLADGANTVAESNEGNNTRTTPISIAGADLIVSALSAPSSRNDGESLTVKDTTKNQGTAPAAASTTSYYWSTDNVYQSTDTLIGSRPVSALSAGASNTGSIGWRIPRGTAAGTYYIIARADAANAVPETSETNNFRTWKIDVK